MRKKRILILFLLTALMLLSLSGCGKKKDKGKEAETDKPEEAQIVVQPSPATTEKAPEVLTNNEATPKQTLSVITNPGAHTEILEKAAQILATEGIQLTIESGYDDYMMPNWAVDGGEYDCNYFQHEAYLKTFNEEQNTNIVSVGKIHFEPLGVYPGNKYRLSDVADGDTVTIPRDTANQARALKLLSDVGFLSLKEGVDPMFASISDIGENPHNLKIDLMEASQIPSTIATSDYVVMTGNIARQALYTVTSDALVYENPATSVAERYANIIAVNAGMENDPRVKRLVEVLKSSQIRSFIENSYSGALVPYNG